MPAVWKLAAVAALIQAAAPAAEAGVGYYYSAPSYHYAPPVYNSYYDSYPGAYSPGFFGSPSVGGYTPAYYSVSTPYATGYPGYSGYPTAGWGYPTYGYISPYRWYGYRPYRYGRGRGLFDFD